MGTLSIDDGIGGADRGDEVADLARVLDALVRLDATADVDCVRAHTYHRVSRVVYAQPTTKNAPRREIFWNERPIKSLSCTAIGIDEGIEQETRKQRAGGAIALLV